MDNLERFEGRLDIVEKQGVELNTRMGNVEGTLRHHGAKLESMDGKIGQVLQAVTVHAAAPKVDMVKMLSVTKDLAILAGLVATLLGFIITSYGASDRAVTQYRIDKLEQRVEHNVQTQSKTDKGGG